MKRREDQQNSGLVDNKGRPIYRWKNTNFFGSPAHKKTRTKDCIQDSRGDFTTEKINVDDMIIPHEGIKLPDHYKPLMSAEEKIEYAYEYADRVAQLGLTPVASSVTGSRLRGVDSETSDVDGLVLVAEDIHRAKSMADDVSVQSLNTFVSTLSTSMPYVEFLRSPFMIADPRTLPYLQSQRVNHYVFNVHAERFVGHLQNRATLSATPEKLFRNSVCAWYTSKTLSPLTPRDITVEDNCPAEVKEWILMCKQNEEIRRALGAVEKDYLAGRITEDDLYALRDSEEYPRHKVDKLINKVVYKKYDHG